MKNSFLLSFTFILLIGFHSCKNKKSEEPEMHRFCGTDFCTAKGGSELTTLLEDTSIYPPVKFAVQLINATSTKNNAINPKDIESELNYIFKKANISFSVHPHIHFLQSNHNIDTIFNNKNIRDTILRQYNVKNNINIYIVAKGKSLNGYTNVLTENFSIYKNTSLNYLIINEKTILNGHTIQHELGHFFGLQHTFGKSPVELSTDELPDGTNCKESGDYVCDTPADPNGKIDQNCKFLGLHDGSEYPVNPDIHNFMSYYPSHCKMKFSSLQYKLMHNFANKYRKYLATL
ncbi:MAG: hypothetical protein K0B10_02665 [Vicingaceae bacterium]|nr:hypothetical protein [Vicingaceae bacterium]